MRRLFLLALALLSAGCPGARPPVPLPSGQELVLRQKGDAWIARVLRENPEKPFAVLVRFRTPVFPYQQAFLERMEMEGAESFGNAALLTVDAAQLPPLLASTETKAVLYLAPQAALPRLHPSLEMEILRRVSDSRENEPLTVLARFREPVREELSNALVSGGFSVDTSAGTVLVLTGTVRSLPALLVRDELLYAEGASKGKPMPQ